ncbi:hypothetical protein [Lacticaseibacillus rhamnosus]|uniref:hypothetical protein n=2 Tax=Lacticaseibacillus rhamnosus TaxID=47715 RepID=UPI00057CC76E|nr:hypothetical protein [Lacticaseibacillus rhamnosus]OFP82914.1 hypothetical protein HMPREF2969_10640 [Lactobacillus sp. HMSC056D05]KIC96902.1 hypothetical protein LaR308_12555 [Lacticaseibacillus rhamnosus]KMO88430.1 hypothetical protein ACS99_13475 [Lacticaseibacillus rhamnosus]MBE8125190.1 hypothetical protein [Lacticaseibacillus rhamnosus]MDE3302049.1 hypothetical protein [Lacticaseibacillus rhamnosus]
MGIFNRKEQPETPDVLNSLNERLSESQQRQKLGGGNQELQQENTGDQQKDEHTTGKTLSPEQLEQLNSAASLATEILKPATGSGRTWSMNISGGTELNFANDQLTVYVKDEPASTAQLQPATPSKAITSQPQAAAMPAQPEPAEPAAEKADKESLSDPKTVVSDNTDAATASQAESARQTPAAAGASVSQLQAKAPAKDDDANTASQMNPPTDNTNLTRGPYYEAQKQNSTLITQIAVLQKMNTRLASQIEQWQTYRTKTTAYLKDLSAKYKAVLAEHEKDQQVVSEFSTLHQQHEELKAQNELLQTQVADLSSHLEAAVSERDKAQAAKEALQNELSKQIVATQIAETDLKHVQADLAAAKQSQQELQTALSDSEAKVARLSELSASQPVTADAETQKNVAALDQAGVFPSEDAPVFESDFPEA